MLRFYLSTIIIWMIIICCVVAMCRDKLVERLGIERDKKKMADLFRALQVLFVIAAIPIIRMIVVICIIYIAICEPEEFVE